MFGQTWLSYTHMAGQAIQDIAKLSRGSRGSRQLEDIAKLSRGSDTTLLG